MVCNFEGNKTKHTITHTHPHLNKRCTTKENGKQKSFPYFRVKSFTLKQQNSYPYILFFFCTLYKVWWCVRARVCDDDYM